MIAPRNVLVAIVLTISSIFLVAQPINTTVGLLPIRLEKELLKNHQNHSSIQPYRLNETSISNGISDEVINRAFSPNWYSYQGRNGRSVSLQPYLEGLAFLQGGEGMKNSAAVGVDLTATLHKKVAVGFTYFRQLEQDLPYLSAPHARNFSPGMGVVRQQNDNTYQFDFFQAYISYSPNQHFNFELGNGKHFIGEGYRSLLLSDNANNSPYFKLSTNFWNLSYTNIWAYHRSIYSPQNAAVPLANGNFLGKYTASHYLDWNISKRFSIGLFETVVWQTDDSLYHRGFDVNYANPLIFYRPVEFSIGSPDNVLIGLNTKLRLFEHQYLYGQLLLDEFLLKEIRADIEEAIDPDPSRESGWWANKFGVQLGWKAFWEVGEAALKTRLEYNLIRPYTYAHSSAVQSYTNFGQSLAHPNGSNLNEWILSMLWVKDRFSLETRLFYLRQGKSRDGLNYGDDLNESNITHFQNYNNRMLQGELFNAKTITVDLSYRLRANSNLEVTLGYWGRNTTLGSDNLVSFGIRTPITRRSREL